MQMGVRSLQVEPRISRVAISNPQPCKDIQFATPAHIQGIGATTSKIEIDVDEVRDSNRRNVTCLNLDSNLLA